MQYMLQHRHDDRDGKLTPDVVTRVVRALAAAAVGSLLDHDEDAWHERIGTVNDTSLRGLLGYAPRVVADLAESRRLGGRIPARCLADAPTRLRRRPHTAVRPRSQQPWLRDLAKRRAATNKTTSLRTLKSSPGLLPSAAVARDPTKPAACLPGGSATGGPLRHNVHEKTARLT